MKQLILFLITLVLSYLLFFIVYKSSKYGQKKMPVEAQFLITTYKLDVNKMHKKALLLALAKVNAFDIAIIVTIISLFNNSYLMLAIGFVLTFVFILISYNLLGKWLQKEGMSKNV